MPKTISKNDLLLAYKKVLSKNIRHVKNFDQLRKELVTGLEGSQKVVVDLMHNEANTVEDAYQENSFSNYKSIKKLYSLIVGLQAACISYKDSLKYDLKDKDEKEKLCRQKCVEFAKIILLTEFLIQWGTKEAVQNAKQ